LTEGIATSAERRFQAGDVAVIDVNVATTALARARSASLASTSDLGAAVGSLKMLLGLEAREEISVRGELDRPAALELPGLLATARSRPDLIALEARIAQAEADARAGGTQGRPGFDVGLRYKQEAEDDIMMGLMTVSLPVFDRGQGTIAEANARAARLRLERDALRRAVETEVTAAFAAWQQRLQAAELIGQILPRVSETDALAGKSYEAGQIGLVEMLVLRRDAVETRVLHADRQLEAALAEVKLEASAGMLR
jgi:cobalt-zinc-cadmium efflux system outer membrane protein